MGPDIMRPGRRLEQDLRLIKIIRSHKWELIDISSPPGGSLSSRCRDRYITYRDLDEMERAETLNYGRRYLFVPMRSKSHKPSQTYDETDGLGPALRIDDIYEDRWGEAVRVTRKGIGYVALFTTMQLLEDRGTAYLTSSEGHLMKRPDIVEAKCAQIVDTFEKHFRIVTPEEMMIIPSLEKTLN